MEKFQLIGPNCLKGDILISGAKNSALPILFASLLTEQLIELKNIPKLKDINKTINLLNYLGTKIKSNGKVLIDASKVDKFYAPYKLVKTIRASIWVLAPLLARFGKAKIFMPGGCKIGARPIDLHIKSLKKLGAKVVFKNGCIKAFTQGKLQGADVFIDKISVGATVSTMTAATLAQGNTVIRNAACEPEIKDTADFLNSLGAKIIGAGTKKICITGVKKLRGGVYKILPDRIETGTFLIAAAISKGKITCHKTKPNILSSVLLKLKQAGADIKIGKDWIKLDMYGKRPNAVTIQTEPYPGFPTDMQAQFTVLNLIAKGVSYITENIFENRFKHIPQLIRMGGCIKVQGRTIICHGVKELNGAKVIATDLRASASLVLAGCIAKGRTIINKIDHIDRGYEEIEKKLRNLCVNVKRI